MTLTLITGNFRIVGASPDGDSVRFYPADADAFRKAGLRVRTNAEGGAQLRLEGIDALETHYRPQVKGADDWRQPREPGDAASAALLEQLGFTSVERDDDGRVTSSTPEQVPGHIMTRFADKYGRPVAFAFAGEPSEGGDGERVHLDVETMQRSANFQQVQTGLAYPTFYSLLYTDLRQAMADAAVAARQGRRGVWERDVTLSGFTLDSREQLREELVVLPKLFRRLADYLALEPGGVSLARFSDYLDTRDDRLFTVPDGHATELHTLVRVDGQKVILTVEPERIVFNEG